MDITTYNCDRCSFRCPTKLELIKHSFDSHSAEPLFQLKCGIQGCLHRFLPGSSFSSFKTHASRKHPNWQYFISQNPITEVDTPAMRSRAGEQDPSLLSLSESEPFDMEEGLAGMNDRETVQMDTITDEELFSSAKRPAALFLLTLKEKYNISQTALDYAVGSVTTIVDQVCSNVKRSVTATLREKGFTEDISGSFNIDQPFHGLETEYRQSSFYKTEFGLVVSIVYVQ